MDVRVTGDLDFDFDFDLDCEVLDLSGVKDDGGVDLMEMTCPRLTISRSSNGEEAIAQRRSWGENLTYYTGIGYLGGAVTGAGKGIVEGVKASEAGDTMKLRVNRILNASGHTGRKFGNRAGVIGLMYAGLESGMVAIRDTDDVVNSVVAGLGTGALYKAASGPRSAAVAGAMGGVVVGLAVTGKQLLKRHVPI
ncbi:Mitochondrial import inner membrane translocase subunit TIM23-2 [Camellia lanceoleosa]|uniref:Mitochondrial import inner membrane translocase subunit TIM23-2 n=1 Tax=Camellia lanceoleosa TaxID=1840588 RepID=A0ACC0I0Y2_9ERIC|nr:Mitochondrial import inner membrane translocase subunit TIM23-2 [Camellia lanceoleosa]